MFQEKKRLATTWSITYFWVLFSFVLAIIATFSFMQADWIIKKSVVVTNYYHDSYVNGTGEIKFSHFSSSTSDDEEDFSFVDHQFVNDVLEPPFMLVEKVHYFRFGVVGLCFDTSCRVFREDDTIDFSVWRVSFCS